jgi:hypothetical protein
MESFRLALSPSSTRTKILLTHGPDELLKGLLPAPSQMRHERAAITLIEALSLWLDRTLPVAVCVDELRDACSCLGLTDDMGIGMRSVFCRVEVTERKGARRRRGTRIPGVGDFRDLRQLGLWCPESERDF